jgi:N-acyl-D-amino-acid deacylase
MATRPLPHARGFKVALLIQNGLIADGTGAPAFGGEIVIERDRIVRITPTSELDRERGTPRETAEVVDATGFLVTPGFIDIHSHSDHTLLADPRAFSSVNQGVTLEVVGNCGFGCFPVEDPDLARSRIYAYQDAIPISWKSAAEYFDTLEGGRPGINVVSLVPNGQLRLAVIGPDGRAATRSEQKEMRGLLEESLEAGAWGISTCLESGEEISMSEDEVAELCRSVAAGGGIHATHTRDRAEHAAEAIQEGIRTAEKAGVRLQVSHLIPDRGIADLEECLAVVDAAADRVDVSFDMHTRLFGIGYLYSAVPPALMQGTAHEVADRLRDPETRRQAASYRSTMSAIGDWHRVMLLDNDIWPEYARQSVAQIASARGNSPMEAICDLLAATSDDLSRLWTVELTFTEDEQRITFPHPLCVPASDAAALAPDGPLAASSFHGAYSWASWFYRYVVREKGLLPLEEGIHKLTGQPAGILGLKDRGVLKPGAFADVAIFDSGIFADKETMFAPNEPAIGMRYVFVNGVLTLKDGALTGERAGRVLRHGSHS